jgi:hypothetical protein
MDIQRETVVEAGISTAAVLVFIAAVVGVGVSFEANGSLSETGGLAILGAIGLFVFVISGIGVWLAYQEE